MTRKPTPAEWSEIVGHFDTLVDLPGDTRAARLTRLKADAFVLDQVRTLLAAEGDTGPLDADVTAAEPADSSYASLEAGSTVGGFRILSLLGRGGMGEVYLAHREAEDFDQRVALKMLRPEAAGRTRLFAAERRLLAGLEHPGIARLIDGGVAPDGRPFMALEYVEGREIMAWCCEHHADLATRLRLFLELCDAVAYAHARLVLHLDIKPSNVLVDSDGRARLLDFGVARIVDVAALDGALTQALLTPEYAAPEQFQGARPTVATDVYALGALLFEMLTGRGPWQFDDAPLPTVMRRLLHDDPDYPSRVTTERGVAGAQLRGDLDAIVLKAMRRNPAERYADVPALAADVQRYLAHRPVRARDGTAGYRLRRFLRRNRWAATAAGLALAFLLVGAGGIAWQARETRRERDAAVAEAGRAEAVNEALTLMFRDASEQHQGETISARALIDRTAKRLVATLDTSAKSAAIVGALSDLYVYVEDIPGSEALLRAALAKGIGAGDPAETAELKQKLATDLGATHRIDEARTLLAEADTVWRGNPDRYRRERVEAVGTEAYMLRQEGKRDAGLALLLRDMPEAERAYAGSPRDLATRYANLATHLVESNRLPEATALIARAEKMLARSGQSQSQPGLTLMQMQAAIAARQGDVRGAEALLARTVAIRRARFGPSFGLAVDLLQHARILTQLDRPAAALKELDEAMPMAAEYFGPSAPPTLMLGLSRAEALALLGRDAEAQAALAKVAPGLTALGPEAITAGILWRTRAVLDFKRGRFDAADQELTRADAIFRKIGPAALPYARATPALRQRIAAAR